MSIAEHIHEHFVPLFVNPIKAGKLSAEETINSFFERVPSFDEQTWPLMPQNKDSYVSYSKAVVAVDHLGMSEEFHLEASLKDARGEVVIAENMIFDDIPSINIASIVRKSKASCGNMVYDLIQSHRRFLRNFGTDGSCSPTINLYASSGNVEGVRTSGGYVWATQGFDFEDDRERDLARRSFKEFAHRHGVNISDDDLKYFQKPCHFAAFQCGVKIDDRNLGRAFLLQYSWNAKMKVAVDNSEEMRYAQEYYSSADGESHIQRAAMFLNKKYLKMMKKYHQKYTQSEQKKKSALGRLKDSFRIFG